MNKIKVMLVEDDTFWQQALSEDLGEEPDIEIVRIVSSKEEAIPAADEGGLDVVLMDINLTENRLDGLEATREIMSMAGSSGPRIIMLTSLQDKDIIVRSFQNGAVNYISKSNYKDMVQAIRDAAANKLSLHPDAGPALLQEIKLSQLTPSEREIYELREKGMSRTEMSRSLNKSLSTIKTQLRSIRDKLPFGSKKGPDA
ncbi:response regulator transcription factor [Paenibacillus hexagrammi]|uniref:Response regulator transcription factor n=1 Tax=Paenibacillus hexagrammi TaxID=2908839 RepID=A0ABY3SKW0_9BACL|nr:response regulator transcription factor [Paenibacillus sp. YPD9-1]UJF34020.1 response regulator transcription factor [Paenibacillus sp. YPD9-1]